MASRTVYIFGAEEIIANLERVVGTLRKNAIRNAMYAGAVVIRDEARSRVAVQTGSLKKTIIARTAKTRKATATRPFIGLVKVDKVAFAKSAKGKLKRVNRRKETGSGRVYKRGDIYPRNYDHLVEFGTKPHMVGSRAHPGAKPKPFMSAALFAKRDAALAAIRNRLIAEAFKDVVKQSVRRSRAA